MPISARSVCKFPDCAASSPSFWNENLLTQSAVSHSPQSLSHNLWVVERLNLNSLSLSVARLGHLLTVDNHYLHCWWSLWNNKDNLRFLLSWLHLLKDPYLLIGWLFFFNWRTTIVRVVTVRALHFLLSLWRKRLFLPPPQKLEIGLSGLIIANGVLDLNVRNPDVIKYVDSHRTIQWALEISIVLFSVLSFFTSVTKCPGYTVTFTFVAPTDVVSLCNEQG